jgi:D-glycero-alpha-D-manno-heptose-7-phosphate kinase
MIITHTPYRMSFFGGGTDYPAWYLKNGGAVLSTTIDKYCYISCRHLDHFFNHKHTIVWSYIEPTQSISEILHPVVREGLKYLGFDDSKGIEMHHMGDLPARTGTGSSSSFSVGFINAFSHLKGEILSKKELADKALYLEQVILQEAVGSQDQVAAAYGGINHIKFNTDGNIKVDPIILSTDRRKELQDRIMLFYISSGRFAPQIAKDIITNIPKTKTALKELSDLVPIAVNILYNGDLDNFGKLLHEGWNLKKSFSTKTSNSNIDAIYSAALEAGALGGKLMGAGDTGFMFFYVPLDKQAAVKKKLENFLQVSFEFEELGSHVILNNENLNS